MLNIHFNWNIPFVDYLNVCHLFMSFAQFVSSFLFFIFYYNLQIFCRKQKNILLQLRN